MTLEPSSPPPISEQLNYTAVREIMSPSVVSVGPQQSLVFAFGLMNWFDIRHLPVVDDNKLVGLVSERDLLLELGNTRARREHPLVVADVMAVEVRTTTPEEDIRNAAAHMALNKIGSLPVVDDDKIVGVLTTTDIVAHRGGLFFKNERNVSVPVASSVMQRIVEPCHPEDKLLDAVALMVSENIRHLPVVNNDNIVVAMLSDRDVRNMVGDPLHALTDDDERSWAFTGKRVLDASTPNPICVQEDTSLYDLAACFLHDRVGALPVVDSEDRLVGVVSYVDLLRFALGARSDLG